MFINILHKTFITESPSNFTFITPEFFDIRKEEDWKNNQLEHLDYGEYLKFLCETKTRQYRVYPIKDINEFLKQYCHALGLYYNEYLEIINYNIFSLKHAEDTFGFPNHIIMPGSKEWYEKPKHSIKRNYECFPAEFAINCLDKKWARNKFHFFRICDIVTEIKKYQRKEYEEYGKISKAFEFLTSDVLTLKSLFDKDFYNYVYQAFKKNNYNTYLFEVSLEEYINDPDCLYGYNELNYYKFNKRLARILQKRGYRIDGK